MAAKLSGRLAGWLSVLLAVTLTGDVWVTYSALSEPLSLFLNLGVSGLLLAGIGTNSPGRSKIVLRIGLMVFLASATHCVAWFLSILTILFSGYTLRIDSIVAIVSPKSDTGMLGLKDFVEKWANGFGVEEQRRADFRGLGG